MVAMTFRLARVCGLLFFSGACALVYQVAWFRELRLIFGASTAASAAVLAVFMGGLGVGGVLLGKRADRAENPLKMYAYLELGVAAMAALTPVLVRIAQATYVALGGGAALGPVGGAVARLVLSVLVLGPTTILMGGTLPAAARAVERNADGGRQRVAALYGINTFGAVAGSLAANFLLLEVFGTQLTQWLAALLNALVGVLARTLSRMPEPVSAAPTVHPQDENEATSDPPVRVAAGALVAERPPWFPVLAAAVAGMTFMLMELVWYRMLGPVLGGSSYTFGLILSVALAGIGMGGGLYVRAALTPTLRLFAITCALEALFIAIPYALGDRIALLALLLRPLCNAGFGASVAVWTFLASIVVLPVAIVSGFQFPVVIGLYGRGARSVGRDVGHAYAANTGGAILGAIAGGFGLLPALSAPGAWRLVVVVLAATTALALVADRRGMGTGGAGRRGSRLAAAGVAALSLLAILAGGPTAVWRHAGIGAGRADLRVQPVSKSGLESFVRDVRANLRWEEDGRESSVAIVQGSGYSFVVNGKADGHVLVDAPTQVMSGMLGALLHPNPRRALVIGLGTGSTAGWLGKIRGMDRVDVVELEPAISRVAKDCALVNEDVLSNPKVAITIADAREALLTTKDRYDIIFSEPSNPYRAGISSLYTAEYYRAALERLDTDGIFIQWVQSYEVDAWAVATVLVTLRDAFGAVSMWQTMAGDILLVAQRESTLIDVDRLRARLEEEAYGRAARAVWHTSSAEGILAHFIGSTALTDLVVERGLGVVNLDDQNFLEFAFARGVGRHSRVDAHFVELARRVGAARPPTKGAVDASALRRERWLYQALENLPADPPLSSGSVDLEGDAGVIEALRVGRRKTALSRWKKLGRAPSTYHEAQLLAHAAAREGDEAYEPLARTLDSVGERALLRALYLSRGGERTYADTIGALTAAFTALRTDPWARTALVDEVLMLSPQIAQHDAAAARRVYDALAEPFAAELHRFRRLAARAQIGRVVGPGACVDALEPWARSFPWQRDLLELRAVCYRQAGDERATRAERELAEFLRDEAPFGAALEEETAAHGEAGGSGPRSARRSSDAAAPEPDEPDDASAPPPAEKDAAAE